MFQIRPALILVAFGSVAGGQPNASARAAALQYVIAHDVLAIPKHNVAIILEPVYAPNQHHGVETRDPQLTPYQAKAMMELLAGSKVARAADVLACVRYDCATRTTNAALFVTQEENVIENGNPTARYRVGVTLYLPQQGDDPDTRRMQGVVIGVNFENGSWSATGVTTGPSLVHPVRVPADVGRIRGSE